MTRVRVARFDLSNILEICLARLEAGETIDEIVAEYSAASPAQATELRALLEIAQAALPEKSSLRVPSTAQRSSRQRFLARAQKLQQQPGAAGRLRWLRFWRFLQHNFGSLAFGMTAILLLVIALGSVRALPGDSLFPVKVAAEQAGISLSGSNAAREERESAFDTRRADEVEAMIQVKRTGPVSFGGFLHQTKAAGMQITGIPLQFPKGLEKQALAFTGAYVEIRGALNSQGTVQVEDIQARLEPLQGTLTSIGPDGWQIGSHLVRVTVDTRVTGAPRVGSLVSIQAARLENTNQVLAVTISVTGEAETATPSVTKTATVPPTVTATATATTTSTALPEPTETEQPIFRPQPTQAPTSESHNGSKPPAKPTSEPTDNHSED